MLTVVPAMSLLLIVDFQSRLMPSIDQGMAAVKNAKRLSTWPPDPRADRVH